MDNAAKKLPLTSGNDSDLDVQSYFIHALFSILFKLFQNVRVISMIAAMEAFSIATLLDGFFNALTADPTSVAIPVTEFFLVYYFRWQYPWV